MQHKLGRREILKKVSLVGAGSAVALMSGAKDARAEDSNDAILGLWLVNVSSSSGSYNYFYSFARGGYTATGDIDEKFLDMKFSPSMGAYIPIGRQSVRYREKGWVYNLAGKNVGTFNSVGAFTVDRNGAALSGPGTYTQFDLKGNLIITEHFLAKGKKIAV